MTVCYLLEFLVLYHCAVRLCTCSHVNFLSSSRYSREYPRFKRVSVGILVNIFMHGKCPRVFWRISPGSKKASADFLLKILRAEVCCKESTMFPSGFLCFFLCAGSALGLSQECPQNQKASADFLLNIFARGSCSIVFLWMSPSAWGFHKNLQDNPNSSVVFLRNIFYMRGIF